MGGHALNAPGMPRGNGALRNLAYGEPQAARGHVITVPGAGFWRADGLLLITCESKETFEQSNFN